jgi:hypothetical protein
MNFDGGFLFRLGLSCAPFIFKCGLEQGRIGARPDLRAWPGAGTLEKTDPVPAVVFDR